MKTFKLIGRGTITISGERPPEPDARSTDLPQLCVCPRCLEPFTRDQCYGGCFSCPLLPTSSEEAR